MDSIDSEQTEDGVLLRTKCHWAMLLGPILVVVIGILAAGSRGYGPPALILFGVIWGYFEYASLRRSEFKLTRDRLLIDAGLVRMVSHDIPLDKIVSIQFYQPSLGSMLNFGKIWVVYGGAKKCVVRFVCDPGRFVTRVQQQMVALRASSTKES